MDERGATDSISEIDREQFESALRKVRSGELSPEQATNLLLSGHATPPPHHATHQIDATNRGRTAEPEPASPESFGPQRAASPPPSDASLAQLIERLGPPPADILQGWEQQLDAIARQHEAACGQPLPELKLSEVTIDQSGCLGWRQWRVTPGWQNASPIKSDAPSLSGSHHKLQTLLEQHCPPPADPSPSAAVTTSPAKAWSPAATGSPAATCATPKSTPPGKAWAVIAFAAGLTLIAGLAIVGLRLVPTGEHPGPATRSPPPPSQGPPQPPGLAIATLEGHATADPDTFQEAASNPTLGKLESISHDELGGAVDEELPDTGESLSLGLPDRFPLIPLAGTGSSLAGTASLSDQGTRPPKSNLARTQPTSSGDASIEWGDAPLDDDATLPEESPQPVRPLRFASVELPKPDQEVTIIELWPTTISNLELGFPYDVPLALASSESGWVVRDRRSQTAVAEISLRDDAAQFRWLESAAQSPVCSALVHGKLREANGQTVYLRPKITADPWPIQMSRPDIRPTWDLREPLPPRLARMAIEFDLPEGIEVGWIEPLQATDVRRGRAVAVFRQLDDEWVSVGIRIDVRGGRKLSCRLRFAARLDPAMPWQSFSEPSLAQFADQLAERITAIGRENQRLAKAYPTVDPEDRPLFKRHQEQTAKVSEHLAETSRRVADLQTLVSALRDNATMRCRVWIEWPDGEQRILEMGSAENGLPREDEL